MQASFRAVLGIAVTFTLAVPANAEVTVYRDETAFLSALSAQGVPTVFESFEDDTVWGSVRTTIPDGPHTAPSVSNLGLTWTSNSVNNEITTGNGPARTGMWGFFSLPHGDYENGIGDGFIGTGDTPMVAIGGWIESNTAPAKLGLYLDGIPVDFGGDNVLQHQHQFFGAIDPAGFGRFEYRELEGVLEDQEFIFADDFTFAFGGTIIDCNENGTPDGLDIAAGISHDCNRNVIPDECEIDENSTAPGGPFYCGENCDPDCNLTGIPDECEVLDELAFSSGQLSPIGDGFPQSFTILDPPLSLANVVLVFTAYANLSGPDEFIDVDINNSPLGTIFVNDGSDCPDNQPAAAQLLVPMETFNDAVIAGGGDAVINMVASTEVAHDECDNPSYITVELILFVSSDADLNQNGIPDECESLSGDSDSDGDVDLFDFEQFLNCETGPGGGLTTGCELFDFDEDLDVDRTDSAAMQIVFTGPF